MLATERQSLRQEIAELAEKYEHKRDGMMPMLETIQEKYRCVSDFAMQEVARQLGVRFVFVEKEEGKLVLRRGFRIAPDESVLVVEDVVTQGGRAKETIDIVRALGGAVKCNSYTKFYLAFLGQFPYENCAAVPPELQLTPSWNTRAAKNSIPEFHR